VPADPALAMTLGTYRAFVQAAALLGTATLGLPEGVRAQTPLEPYQFARLMNDDLAVLAGEDDRSDLGCRVNRIKPEMAFDLRFHAGYTITIPLRSLAGDGNQLRILMRVTPLDAPENELYLVDRFTVPPIEENARGEAYIPGEFTVGPGRYQVDWLMRDRTERVCSAHWEIKAELDDVYRNVPLSIAANTPEPRPQDPFRDAPRVPRDDSDKSLHVKILVNYSPGDPNLTTLRTWDLRAITAILRGIAREPKIGKFSLVAFSMSEQRVIYREDNANEIDFPALGNAVSQLKTGTIDFELLQDRRSATRFLTTLLTEHLGPQQPAPDAIIIVGPKVMLEHRVPHESLKEAGSAGSPIFYLNYNANPRRNPWRDTIAGAIRAYKGLEYTITLPRDLGSALTDVMSHLSRQD
jgi:hypothetical protein